jgi:hypothetical protein
MATRHIRGDFPKGPADETADNKRLRYERWIIETHDQALARLKVTRFADPEREAILAQSYRWGRINEYTKTGSKILAVKARCWQCVGSEDDDATNKATIAQCSARNCALWSVRPFQPAEDKIPTLPIKEVVRAGFKKFDFLAKALAHPGNRTQAIKGYCHECKGGESSRKTRYAVVDCADANCALWFFRGKLST